MDADEAFRDALRPHERVRWTGGPAPAIIRTRGDAFMIVFGLVWSAASLGILGLETGLWTFGPDVRISGELDSALVVSIIFCLVGFYFLGGRLLVNAWMKRRTRYALTEDRALVVVRGWLGSVRAASFDRLESMSLALRRDGFGTIRFGATAGQAAVFENTGMDFLASLQGGHRAPAFFDIPDARTVFDLATDLVVKGGGPG